MKNSIRNIFLLHLFLISIGLAQPTPFPNYNYIHINNIKMWVGNDGSGSHDPITDGSGLIWPANDEDIKTLVFADGLIWGCKINGEVFVNGNTHYSGLQPGKILANGKPDIPTLDKYKVYKIRKDWETFPPGPTRDKLQKDFYGWPVEDGAPWADVNDDGKYTTTVDQPLLIGDEVLWYVSNDLDTSRSLFTFRSLPIGLEFQTTVWGYKLRNLMQDVVFKKYKIINKSLNTLEDMYFGYWSDPDIGNAGDDYVGCDSVLSLGYAYNAASYDEVYKTPPPAVGYVLLKNSKVSENNPESDQSLHMTSFIFYPASFYGPIQPNTPTEMYNNLRGRVWNGSQFYNPLTNEFTTYLLSGDPETQTGWYEGEGWPGHNMPPGDRRFLMGSGPVTMVPGDTQEVVIAILAAKGLSNVNSVTKLKDMAAKVKLIYDNYEIPDVKKIPDPLPEHFYLSGNYPNPFNPTTKIDFAIPIESKVVIKVFDILGNEVAVLTNKNYEAGEYSITFDGSNLASGVYIYNIYAREYFKSFKMLLMK